MPYKRTYTDKDGRKRVTYYSDIRPRRAGKATGGRVRRLLPGVTNMADAREAEKKIEEEMAGAVPLLTDFLRTTYLPWARENKARADISERHVRLISKSPHFKGRRVDEISVIQVEGFKKELKESPNEWKRQRGPGHINNTLAELSRALRLAQESGLARGNPARLASRLDYHSPPFRILEREEEAALWAALKPPPRYILPLSRLALLTGMREGELLALTPAAVDFARGLVFVLNPKWKRDKRKTEGLPVSREALEILAKLCAERKAGPLFVNDDGSRVCLSTCSNLFRRRALKAGVTGMNFHDLRHTFGTRLGEAVPDPYRIARLMGHATIQTSMLYVHPSDTSLRSALEKMGDGHDVVTAKREKAG